MFEGGSGDHFIYLSFKFLFQELEEILTDVTSAVSEAICQEGEIITDKVNRFFVRLKSVWYRFLMEKSPWSKCKSLFTIEKWSVSEFCGIKKLYVMMK